MDRLTDKDFFEKSSKEVAREILGNIIVRKIGEDILMAKIVETEAYFGNEDPASRACQNGDLRRTMMMEPGTILVYGVHNNWLINFVTDKENVASAVLIRAVEPLNFQERGDGPGLVCRCLKITKEFHKKNILNNPLIWIEKGEKEFEIVESFRIGVRRDLDEPLRFYIKGNKFVSKE